jgi:hypothetical protein
MKTARLGMTVVGLGAADANSRNPMDSSAGSAISAPVPRKKCRRLVEEFINIMKLILSLPPVSKSSSHTPQSTNLSKLKSELSLLGRKSYSTILIQRSPEDPQLNPTVLSNSSEN